MDPKWHIAFLNISITQYAEVTFRDYYADPANTLEAQLRAADVVERRFGVGRFLKPRIDTPIGALPTLLGAQAIVPEEDELPAIDTGRPVITDLADAGRLRIGDPANDGYMALRRRACEYYRSRGYDVTPGGHDGSIVTTACEISGNAVLAGLLEAPESACAVFDKVLAAHRAVEAYDATWRSVPATGAYIGDDFAGLISPFLFRQHVVPYYQKVFDGKSSRFLHSELLFAEHLRIARDLVCMTDFHGAGAENLTPQEMHDILGNDFWVQVTPHELCAFGPAQLDDRIRELAASGAHTVQLYPGRCTPDRNLEAAIAACRRECPGGPRW